ncbi:MAG: signal peptidase I [Clostridia bacterium]|nr:signal peptidase I [Clostridia bacterium]
MNENIEINETEQLNEAVAKETKLTFAQRLVEIASIIASSIIAIMLIFTFVFRVVGVSGPSMMNTLRNGDWLLVSAFITEPERGDIVIVTQPNTFNEPIVKRVIAVGGDTIDIDFAAATVTVNGKVINEPYLATPTTDDEGGWTYPLTLEEGQVFVMGDNRQHSTDSRSADIGLIDENYILGQVMVRFSPLSSFTIFGDYDYE